MRSRDKRASHPDIEALREERRKLLNDAQAAYFDLLGKDADAAADLEKETHSKLRDLVRRMDVRRHKQAPTWALAHEAILDRFRKLADVPRIRRLDPGWPGLSPRPLPEDYLEGPRGDRPGILPQEVLCSVTTSRIETTANHGETVTKSPQSTSNIVAGTAFDATPGLNEVKLAVEINNGSTSDDVATTVDAVWRFDFYPPADGLYTIRPLAFLNGVWALWASTPGVAPSAGVLDITVGVRVSQYEGTTLYETTQQDVVSVSATDESLEGEITYESASMGTPLELSAHLIKASRTHIIVRCTVAMRLAGSGLVRVNLEDSTFYFRVPEVQVDRFDCQGLLPSDRPRLQIQPSLLAMRKNEQFQIRITADAQLDGSVELTSSNPAAVSVRPSINLQGGVGTTTLMAGESNRQVTISADRDGYASGHATVHTENSRGSWELGPYIDGFVSVHAAILRTGKVLMFSASHKQHGDLAEIDKGRSFLWEPESGSVTEIPIARNLFCSGHCFLADGRLLVAGGQNLWQLNPGTVAGYFGGVGADKDVHTFDPLEERWNRHEDLSDKRWYPTCVTTPTGSGMIVGGTNYGNAFFDNEEFNADREIFRPNTNSVTNAGYFRNGLLYPFLQVLPGGFLFVHRKRHAEIFDLDTEDWLRAPDGTRLSFRTNHEGTRTYPGQGCCVPLTIDPTDTDRTAVLVIGGSKVLAPDKDSETTNSVEIFEFFRSNPTTSRWRQIAPLPDRRFMCDGVLLADGSIFVTNGAEFGTADENSSNRTASYIFEPWNAVWQQVEDSPRMRTYHSVALLMPDGRVIVGGSTGHDLLFHRGDEFRLDIFTPPYLTRGPRPTILEAPDQVEYGEEFEISVGTFSAKQILQVVLIRPGSTTHSNNMDQRRVMLPILERSGSTVRVAAPVELSVAPRGFYMLFVLNQFGVPSVATFVRLGWLP
jgi:hypothetical protein